MKHAWGHEEGIKVFHRKKKFKGDTFERPRRTKECEMEIVMRTLSEETDSIKHDQAM